MTKLLENRVALVTGASRGIGAAIAKGLAREGAHVVLLARTIGGLQEVDDEIREAGGSATLLPMPLTRFDEIEKIGPSLHERFGRCDILVGNAATLGELGPIAQSDPKEWHEAMDVNVMANYHLIRTLDPLLRASDAGRAVFVTSYAAQMVNAYWGAYSASKAALDSMVKIYAAEVEKTNLRVNLLDPGITRTSMRAKAFPGENPDSLKSAEDIVPACLGLVSPTCKHHGEIIDAERYVRAA